MKYLRLALALFLTVLIGQLSSIANQEAVDPLFKDLSAVQSEITNQLGFDFPSAIKPIPLNHKGYLSVVAKAHALKLKIRDASLARTKNSEIRAFSKVVLGYINIQDTITMNYLGLAHSKPNQESFYSLNNLDSFNLQISTVIARNYYHDKTLHLANRIQHDQNNPTEWSFIKLDSISAIALEMQVLGERTGVIKKADGSYEIQDYLKYIQISVLNERLQNHRVLERYLGPFAVPNLKNCATNLVSVREVEKERGIYESMRAPDLAESFTEVYLKPVTAALQTVRLVPLDQYAPFLDAFLSQYSEYTNLKLLPMGQSEIDKQFQKWEAAQFKTWNGRSQLAIESSNFVNDSWTAAATARRIALSTYEFQKNEFKNLLNTAVKEYMPDSFKTNPLPIQKAIDDYVEKTLVAKKADFIKQTSTTLQNIEASKANLSAFQSHLLKRRKDLEGRLSKDIESVREAHSVENAIDSYLANHSSGRTGSSYEIAMLKQYPGERVFPLLPANLAIKYNGHAPQPIGGPAPQFTEIALWFEEKIKLTKAPYFAPFAEHYAKKLTADPRLNTLKQMFFANLFAHGLNLAQKRVLETKNTKTIMTDYTLSPSDVRQLMDDATRTILTDYYTALTTPPKMIYQNVKKEKVYSNVFEKLQDENNAKFAAPISTGTAKFDVTPLDNSFYIADLSTRQDHIRQVIEMFSLVHQGVNAAKALHHPMPNFGKNKAGVPILISHTAIDADFESYKTANNLIPLSLLDVKILSKIRKDAAIHKNALFRAPMTPDLSADDDGYKTFSDAFQNNYLSVQPLLNTLFTNASVRSITMINSACQAKPLIEGDEKYRYLFRSAELTRKALQLENSTIQEIDEEASEFARSRSERILEDWLEPIGIVAGIVMLVALVVFFAPLASQAIAYLSSGVASLGSFATTCSAIGAGTATGSKMLIVLSFLAGSTVTTLSTLILVTMPIAKIYINVWELPAQLKYQLNANAANVGGYESGRSSPQDLKEFAKSVRTQPYWSAGEIALFTVPMIPGWVSQVRSMSGLKTAAALKRLENAVGVMEGESLAAKPVVTGLKSFQEWISSAGPMRGTMNYLQQQWGSFFRYGRVLTLRPGIKFDEMYNLFGKNLFAWVKTEDRMVQILTGRLNQLQKEMEFHIDIAKRLGLDVRHGEYVSTAAEIKFKDLLKGTISKYIGTSAEYKQLIFDYKLLLRSDPKPLGFSFDPATKSLVILEDAGVIVADAKDAAQFKALLHVLHANSVVQKQTQVTGLLEKLTMTVKECATGACAIEPKRIHTLDSFIHSLNPSEWGTMMDTLREFHKWSRGWTNLLQKFQKIIHPNYPYANHWEFMGFHPQEVNGLGSMLSDIEKVMDESQRIQAVHAAWDAKKTAKETKDFVDDIENQWNFGDNWAFGKTADDAAPNFDAEEYSYYEFFMTGGK